ncbi:MAG: hypothetical protein ACRDSE_18050 [Pseudonocardiaceae bacterium]
MPGLVQLDGYLQVSLRIGEHDAPVLLADAAATQLIVNLRQLLAEKHKREDPT